MGRAAGFVTGIACVALAVAQRIETFPIGIANNVFFIVLFADARLYADVAPAGGLHRARVHGLVGVGEAHARAAGGRARELRLLRGDDARGRSRRRSCSCPILRAAHGAAPGWDALTTSMSLGAQLLLNLKRLETWYVWIAVDVIYVPLYFSAAT